MCILQYKQTTVTKELINTVSDLQMRFIYSVDFVLKAWIHRESQEKTQ